MGDQTQTVEAKFHSACNNLRLVRVPQVRQLNEKNEFEVSKGETHTFKNGVLVVTSQTSERYPGLLEWLREHGSNGKLFHEIGDVQPSRTGTDSSEVVAQIVALAVEGDSDSIGEILVAERNNQSRPEVIAAATKAIEEIDGEQPAPDDVPLHQQTRTRPAGPHVGPAPGSDGEGEPVSPTSATGEIPPDSEGVEEGAVTEEPTGDEATAGSPEGQPEEEQPAPDDEGQGAE